jgi:hypothetical protein
MVAGTNSTVFINEFHYDNASTDVGEFIEIANTTGQDLTGWSVVLYNGSNGLAYDTIPLSGTGQFQTLTFPSNGIQNGSPDGIALVDAGNALVQFLSYEGDFTANDGPAAGLASTDIGVTETGSTPVGDSLQLTGAGSTYGDFVWTAPQAETPGGTNTGQTIAAPPSGTPVFVNEVHYDNAGADVGEFIEIAGPAGTDLAGWSIAFYNGNGGGTYGTLPLSGIIPDQDDGYGTLAFAYSGIQNGAPDGFALIDDGGAVVQFLSYEGVIIAVGGPADGMTSIDIGVSEATDSAVGDSLQLTGNGTVYEDFVWAGSSAQTGGGVNSVQDFGAASAAGTLSIEGDPAMAEGDSGATLFLFTVTRSGGSNGAVSAEWAVVFGDTDASDFASATTGIVSLADGETSATIEILVSGDTEIELNEVFSVELANPAGGATIGTATASGTIIDDDTPPLAIYEIQGAGHTSPFDGQSVTTTGIVTAVDSNGFYIQDAVGDGNDATSDGIFVFTASVPTVTPGDEVRVTGDVDEYTPGGSSSGNLSITEITSPAIVVLSSGNAIPGAVVLGVDRTPPTETIDDDAFASFDPATDGIDFYESLEGMSVTIKSPVAVGPTNGFGELWVLANDGAEATNVSARGSVVVDGNGGNLGTTDEGPGSDFNPERIQIDADSTLTPGEIPDVDTGTKLADVTGIVSYSFGNYEVLATQAVTVETLSSLAREGSLLASDEDHLTVASFNVHNLDPNDSDGDSDVADGLFDLIADDIVLGLNAPSIVALQEVQDNSGSANDGTVSASETLQMLVDAIAAAGGPTYEWVDNPFIVDGANGGQPGGNIRTAYLYNPAEVSLVDGSVRSIEADDQATDTSNPFYGARLPLVATFEFNDAEIMLVNNHFTSKGGSTSLFGAIQPSENGNADDRAEQAQAVADFVAVEQGAVDGVIVLGDLNEFQFEDPLDPLYDAGLLNLAYTLPVEERYSYNFEGNAQSLDHMFVTASVAAIAEFDIVHRNSEFLEESRSSDHDPLLVSITIPANAEPIARDDYAATKFNNAARIDVLANDSDEDGDSIEIVTIGDAANGTVTVNSDGSLTYTPDAGFKQGTDSFEYTVSDGNGGFDTATVIVDVFRQGPQLNDVRIGTTGNDTLAGGSGDDFLDGRDGNDMLNGNKGNDILLGGAGDDILVGHVGDDVLRGGTGVDVMSGGKGADMFVFDDAETGATLATADMIVGFDATAGDVINLSLVDAIGGGSDDAFVFLGNAAFSGTAGELRSEIVGTTTVISGDTNGDTVADLVIILDSPEVLAASAFML